VVSASAGGRIAVEGWYEAELKSIAIAEAANFQFIIPSLLSSFEVFYSQSSLRYFEAAKKKIAANR
jgi:hypothetical protein